MNNKERTLSNFLIYKSFQLKVIGCLSALFIFSIFSSYTAIYLFYWNIMNKGLKVGIPEGHVFYEFLLEQKHSIDVLFIGLAVFNFLLLVSIALIITHRVAGPINKLKHFLKHPESKDEFFLREKDFFQELKPLVENFREPK